MKSDTWLLKESKMNTYDRSPDTVNETKPTLDPGCLEAISIVRSAAGPSAVVPP